MTTVEPATDYPGNRITLAEAKRMMDSGLRRMYTEQLMSACAPITWWPLDDEAHRIAHGGTMTFLKTEKRILGITAAHVLEEYEKDCGRGRFALQVFNSREDDILKRVIDTNAQLDIATLDVDDQFLERTDKKIIPAAYPSAVPSEGSGIMIAGFPMSTTIQGHMEADFGLFTVLGTASTVTPKQITWRYEKLEGEQADAANQIPPAFDAGGISGGPLLAWFGSKAGVLTSALCGVVTEATLLNAPGSFLEKIAAARIDVVTASGKIIAMP